MIERPRGRAATILIVWALLAPGLGLAGAPAQGLAELMRGMASSRGVAANFHELKRIAVLREPIETQGRLYFVPPGRMRRELHVPVQSRLIIDGSRVRMEEGGGVRDLSDSPMARAFVENFVVLWSGDLEALEERYQVSFEATGSDWEMTLVPRDPNMRRAIDSIVLRGSSESLREIETREVDGDRTLTTLQDVEPDRVFSDAEIRRLFPKPSGSTFRP